MPLLDLYLLSLSAPISRFLSSLRSTSLDSEIIAISECRYLYIPSSYLDAKTLNGTQWTLLLLVRTSLKFPQDCQSMISTHYKLTVGVPGKLLAAYPQHNRQLLRDARKVQLTGSLDEALRKPTRLKDRGKDLELSDDLRSFMDQMIASGEGDIPTSMLNLLRFRDGEKESYMKYGQGFQQAGGRRGGNAKIVGSVVKEQGDTKEQWDEIAFVHYPSIRHFCDMAAGEDYQNINQKYRVGALKDTLLLCTTEIDLLGQWGSLKL